MSPGIDAHQHFWRYEPREYAWIGESMRMLRRDFLPRDLAPEIAAAGIGGVISVQARQTLEETAWLLDLAARHSFICGVVGWAPLTDAGVADSIAAFAENPKLRGLRHALQDEPDPDYMLRADFNRGVAALREFGLAYDILIYERHLPQAIQFVDRHPRQVFVLDHMAKPRIRDGAISPWRENLRELAQRGNVYCKISGMATEGEGDWTPYFDAALEAFGPARLMFGSDWPVCLAAISYAQWRGTVLSWIARLSATEQARILGGTAAEVYGLPG